MTWTRWSPTTCKPWPRHETFHGPIVIDVDAQQALHHRAHCIVGTTAIKHVEEAVAALDIRLSDDKIQVYVTHPALGMM